MMDQAKEPELVWQTRQTSLSRDDSNRQTSLSGLGGNIANPGRGLDMLCGFGRDHHWGNTLKAW